MEEISYKIMMIVNKSLFYAQNFNLWQWVSKICDALQQKVP